MLLACRHPELVARLIVVDIAPRDYFWPGRRTEFAAMNSLQVGALHSRLEAERHFEGSIESWAMRKFIATNLERGDDGRWRWTINLPVLAAALTELERNPLGFDERFEGPALFITGGKSPYVTSGDGAAIYRHFPAAQLAMLAYSGHNPHIEAREAFVALVNGAE